MKGLWLLFQPILLKGEVAELLIRRLADTKPASFLLKKR